MGDLKATLSGLNSITKSLAGLPYRAMASKAWSMSSEEIALYQKRRFADVYESARKTIPYYVERPDSYRPFSSSEDVTTFLSSLPIISKQTLREFNKDFYPRRLPMLTRFHTTSGTSGTPLRLAATLSERAFDKVIEEEWYKRICETRHPRTIYLSGFMTPKANEELYWRDRISGNIYLSIYSLINTYRDDIIALIRRFRPQLIAGYASAVNELAHFVGSELEDIKGNCIAVVTSEVLQPHWRVEIESSLCRHVYDSYGSQEGCHRAIECETGTLHLHPLVGILEVVDESGKAVAPGGVGSVVVTGLARSVMPLIRYDLGDAVEVPMQSDCSCSLVWPAIGRVDGRSEDLVRTRDGRHIGYLCFHATKNITGIKEAQIVQLDYERFVVNLVKSDVDVNDDEITRSIQSQLVMRLRTNVEVEFKFLETIPRGSRGKFKAVVVKLGDKA